jgi:hypothetical protein
MASAGSWARYGEELEKNAGGLEALLEHSSTDRVIIWGSPLGSPFSLEISETIVTYVK